MKPGLPYLNANVCIIGENPFIGASYTMDPCVEPEGWVAGFPHSGPKQEYRILNYLLNVVMYFYVLVSLFCSCREIELREF